MKNHTSRKRLSKHLKGFIKPFPRYGKAINAIVLFGVMILLAGAITGTILHIQAINVSKHSLSNKSTGSDNSSTQTPTTQPAQSTTPSTASTTTTPKPSSSSSSEDSQTVALENQESLIMKCDNETSAADDALRTVYNSAQATYNTDIANGDQQAESDYPAGSDTLSEVEYNILNGEIAKYNATVAPAWATYQNAYNTINSQGCNLSMTYSESDIMKPVLPNYSPGPTFTSP